MHSPEYHTLRGCCQARGTWNWVAEGFFNAFFFCSTNKGKRENSCWPHKKSLQLLQVAVEGDSSENVIICESDTPPLWTDYNPEVIAGGIITAQQLVPGQALLECQCKSWLQVLKRTGYTTGCNPSTRSCPYFFSKIGSFITSIRLATEICFGVHDNRCIQLGDYIIHHFHKHIDVLWIYLH